MLFLYENIVDIIKVRLYIYRKDLMSGLQFISYIRLIVQKGENNGE